MSYNLVDKIRTHFALLSRAPRDWFYCASKGVNWRYDWRLRGLPDIRRNKSAIISIGKRFHAVSQSQWNAIGISQKVLINAFGINSVIKIGDDVRISGCTIAASKSIEMGHRILIGSGALIMDNDAHPIYPENRHLEQYSSKKIKSAPVVIGDDVFIGARAIILKGVRIGKGSVVGAGAIVTKSIPDYAIVVGNPAKVIGDSRNTEKLEETNKIYLSQTI